MVFRPLPLAAGALAALGIAAASHAALSPAFVERLETQTREAVGERVAVDFRSRDGLLTRHPELSGAVNEHPDTRLQLARRVDALPGVGSVHWRDEQRRQVKQVAAAGDPMFCERRVQAILTSRTIRFNEGSARLDPASSALLNEVAEALRPCIGSRIAILGHTDDNGPEEANRLLSERRALRVRDALARRGIPAEEFVIEGKGSLEPIEGLDPADPANRRIEFELLQKSPLVPRPVDTPGAG